MTSKNKPHRTSAGRLTYNETLQFENKNNERGPGDEVCVEGRVPVFGIGTLFCFTPIHTLQCTHHHFGCDDRLSRPVKNRTKCLLFVCLGCHRRIFSDIIVVC